MGASVIDVGKFAVTALVCTSLAGSAAAVSEEHPDFQFAVLKYSGANPGARMSGLARLAWEVRRRTSISINLEPAQVAPDSGQVFDFPFLVWQGDAGFSPLPDTAIRNLRKHLTAGGLLLIDISDGQEMGPFHRAVTRDLKRIFPDRPLQRIATDHVLYKTFYLIDRHGGRVSTRSYLEGIIIEGRVAAVLSTNDLSGAMARDAFGEWEYDVGAGGETTREMSFRLGINLVMYALCLDYKADQVHIPFILQRRR